VLPAMPPNEYIASSCRPCHNGDVYLTALLTRKLLS